MTATLSRPLVIGVFPEPLDASVAYRRLLDLGYTADEINVLLSADRLPEFKEHLQKQSDGSYTVGGLAIGAAVGATAATLVALAVPGLNLIAGGALLAALGGTSAGTVTGGLIGGMMDLSIPESNATAYEQTLREGGVILAVVPREGEEDVVRECFEQSQGLDVYSAG